MVYYGTIIQLCNFLSITILTLDLKKHSEIYACYKYISFEMTSSKYLVSKFTVVAQ